MLAARIHEWGALPIVEEVADPEPDGITLVRVEAAAVAHIDLTVATGEFRHKPQLPYVPGTEGAGRVLRSRRFAEGTPVRIRGARVGLERDGTWAGLAAVPDEAAHEVPDGTDPTLAATFFSPCVTAHLAIHEVGAVRPSEVVAVRGAAGAVGSVAVQLALAAGARVVGVEASAERAETIPDGAERLVGDAGLEGVDVLVDLVGGGGLADVLTRAIRPGGRAVLVGYAAGTAVELELPSLLAAEVRLLPVSLIRREAGAEQLALRLLERLVAGELRLEVTELPLDRAADAMDVLRRGEAKGKVAVLPPKRER